MDPGSNEPTLNCEASAGSLLGLPGVIANRPYSLTAIALRAAHVSFIARDDFNALMQSNPHLSLMILQVLAAEVRSARLALTQFSYTPEFRIKQTSPPAVTAPNPRVPSPSVPSSSVPSPCSLLLPPTC